MAKEIVWTESSIKDRFRIYKFWLQHNKSDTFSEKLEKLFNESARLLALFPEMGTPTDIADVRVKVIRSYKIFYQVRIDSIEIIRVWDSRQNPEDLSL
ncbi:type II toxin-antitoxin system RelE/ParE family toxin [Ohtaekwangia sp.]|uniref:type II toxin-antitoxin system RelE/ParE family toxin n=1 Tax=Ohtaekwangia sp. TaxID=2066019 RepID=UPI002F94B0F1